MEMPKTLFCHEHVLNAQLKVPHAQLKFKLKIVYSARKECRGGCVWSVRFGSINICVWVWVWFGK
jgi:hypothetical protein